MTPSEWGEVRRLYDEASERTGPERERLLALAHAPPEIEREVRELLAQLDQEPGFLEGGPSLFPEVAHPVCGRRIGPWRLVEEIGHGGMGTVYRAVREGAGAGQEVALKVVRAGGSASWAVERFLSEMQILASLDHPHIARFFEGGVTREGLPYFAMEFVQGEPIVEWADRHALGVHERLALFRPVCEAIQYAHGRLVVHRDIKPGNVLVTPEGSPRLLDFGIAKLVDPDDGSPQERTATLFRLLTPEYASPEQVQGGRITTASDIYSLGVLLYRLLAGRGPYWIPTPSPQALLRAVREQEPMSVRERLGMDLDAILAMAMEKEPERRYASAGELSADLKRVLDEVPVHARKDTFSYRLAKLARRHRLGTAAAVLVLVTLAAGSSVAVSRQRRLRRLSEELRSLAGACAAEADAPLPAAAGSLEARRLLLRRTLRGLETLAKEGDGDAALAGDIARVRRRLEELDDRAPSGASAPEGALVSSLK